MRLRSWGIGILVTFLAAGSAADAHFCVVVLKPKVGVAPEDVQRIREESIGYVGAPRLDVRTAEGQAAIVARVKKYLETLERGQVMVHDSKWDPSSLMVVKTVDKNDRHAGILFVQGGRMSAVKLTVLQDPHGLRYSESVYADGIPSTFFGSTDGLAELSRNVLVSLDRQLQDFAFQVRNAYAAEKIGGPRVIGVGFVGDSEKMRPMIELEWKNLTENSFSGAPTHLYSGIREAVIEKPRTFDLATNGGLSRKAAALFVSVLEEGYIPHRPDFFLSDTGKISWLDSSNWRSFTAADEDILESFTQPLREVSEMIHDSRIHRPMDPINQHFVKVFYDEFMARVDASPRLSHETKKKIFEELRAEHGYAVAYEKKFYESALNYSY